MLATVPLLTVVLAAPPALSDTWTPPGTLVAQQEEDEEFLKLWEEVRAEVEQMLFEFPELAPTLDVYAGYRHFDVSGSKRALEYGRNESSYTAGAHFTSYSLTNRMNLEGKLDIPYDFKGLSDYTTDLSYRFTDLFFVRAVVTGVQHNIDEYQLIDPGPLDRFSTATRGQQYEDPYVRTSAARIDAVFRAPGFPAHLFVNGWIFHRDRDRNLQILGGNGFWDRLERTSVPDDLVTLTTDLRFGANSHLGPVEVEVAHTELSLERRSGPKTFTYSLDPNGSEYAHNRVPGLTGRRDELLVHTSYTGRIVASGKVARATRENKFSEVSMSSWSGIGNLQWMPIDRLTFLLGYNTTSTSYDSPKTVLLNDFSSNDADFPIPIRPPIEGTTQNIKLNARYRAGQTVTLRAKYRNHTRTRDIPVDDNDGDPALRWKLPKKTVRNEAGGDISVRLGRDLELLASYTRIETDTPAYNWDDDHQDKVTAEVRWDVGEALTIHGDYSFTNGSREKLLTDIDQRLVEPAGRKEHDSQSIFVTAMVDALPGVQVNTTYAYLQSDHQQSILFQDYTFDDPGYLDDEGAMYSEDVHVITVNVSHTPADWLTVHLQGVHTNSNTEFTPTLASALEPVSVGAFSKARIYQNRVVAGAQIRFMESWWVDVDGRWAKIDFGNRQYNPRQDGKVWGAGFALGKGW